MLAPKSSRHVLIQRRNKNSRNNSATFQVHNANALLGAEEKLCTSPSSYADSSSRSESPSSFSSPPFSLPTNTVVGNKSSYSLYSPQWVDHGYFPHDPQPKTASKTATVVRSNHRKDKQAQRAAGSTGPRSSRNQNDTGTKQFETRNITTMTTAKTKTTPASVPPHLAAAWLSMGGTTQQSSCFSQDVTGFTFGSGDCSGYASGAFNRFDGSAENSSTNTCTTGRRIKSNDMTDGRQDARGKNSHTNNSSCGNFHSKLIPRSTAEWLLAGGSSTISSSSSDNRSCSIESINSIDFKTTSIGVNAGEDAGATAKTSMTRNVKEDTAKKSGRDNHPNYFSASTSSIRSVYHGDHGKELSVFNGNDDFSNVESGQSRHVRGLENRTHAKHGCGRPGSSGEQPDCFESRLVRRADPHRAIQNASSGLRGYNIDKLIPNPNVNPATASHGHNDNIALTNREQNQRLEDCPRRRGHFPHHALLPHEVQPVPIFLKPEQDTNSNETQYLYKYRKNQLTLQEQTQLEHRRRREPHSSTTAKSLSLVSQQFEELKNHKSMGVGAGHCAGNHSSTLATVVNNKMSKKSKKDKQQQKEADSECKWRTAEDPKTGRAYYYHTETRETQWRKPIEMATPEERREVEEKEQRQRDFFSAMEANILKSISSGAFSTVNDTKAEGLNDHETKLEESASDPPSRAKNRGKDLLAAHRSKESPKKMSHDDLDCVDDLPVEQPVQVKPRPPLVRTISTMDENILKELVSRVPSYSLLCSHSNINFDFDPDSSYGQYSFSQTDYSHTEDDGGNDEITPSAISAMNMSYSQIPRPARVPRLGSIREDLEENHAVIAARKIQKELESMPDEDDFDESDLADQIAPRRSSITTILNNLPQAANSISLNDSIGFIGHESIKDYQALQQLAQITEKIAHVPTETDEEEKVNELVPADDNESVPAHDNGSPKRSQAAQQSLDNMPTAPIIRPGRPQRRNTCGTLYVASTMAAPDKDATIKCVCAVYRAHILQAELEGAVTDENDDHHVFNDLTVQQKRGGRIGARRAKVPSMAEVSNFYGDVYRRAQMESDCIIMSLIYVERLIKETNGALRPRPANWRSVLFSCMVLASKVWDDMSMWNADFSQTCPAGIKFSLQRVNQLEIAILSALNFEVKVPASEYAKYYFLLRSMVIKSGLAGDDIAATPLDVDGARRLQHVSSVYQARHAHMRGEELDGSDSPGSGEARSNSRTSSSPGTAQRSKSIGTMDFATKRNAASIGLEHVVQM